MLIGGKTIVITGAATGIGRASAVRFAEQGAGRIIIADIDEAGMAETARLAGAKGAEVRCDRLDLSDIPALEAWMEGLAAEGYDVFYNNAGVVAGAPAFPEAPVSRLRWMIDINFTSLIVATQAAAQQMRARGGGVIINTVSTVALNKGGFSDALYAATKGGVMLFTRSCAGLKDSWNVRVAGVLPGLTNTPILKKTGADGDYAPWMAPILAGNLACEPDDIAAAVIDLVEDDALPGGDWVAVRKIDGRIVRQWGHEEG